MKQIWKYLEAGVVKHEMYNDVIRTSICGVSTLWYVNDTWKDDQPGLDARRECKLCPDRKRRDEKRKEEEDKESVSEQKLLSNSVRGATSWTS